MLRLWALELFRIQNLESRLKALQNNIIVSNDADLDFSNAFRAVWRRAGPVWS